MGGIVVGACLYDPSSDLGPILKASQGPEMRQDARRAGLLLPLLLLLLPDPGGGNGSQSQHLGPNARQGQEHG